MCFTCFTSARRNFTKLSCSCSGGVWTDPMLSDPCGRQAFVDGITMHVVTVAQLMEEAMPHLSKHKVPTPLSLAAGP